MSGDALLAYSHRDTRRERHSHHLSKKCGRREVVGFKSSIYYAELTSSGSLSYSVRKALNLDKLVSPGSEHVYPRQNSYYVE